MSYGCSGVSAKENRTTQNVDLLSQVLAKTGQVYTLIVKRIVELMVAPRRNQSTVIKLGGKFDSIRHLNDPTYKLSHACDISKDGPYHCT